MLEQSIVDNLLQLGNCLNFFFFLFGLCAQRHCFAPVQVQEILKTTVEA